LPAKPLGSKIGGFFYCPDEAIDPRDRGQIMLECGQIIRKVTNQRRSAIRTGPSASDKPVYENFRVVAGVSHPKDRNRLKKKYAKTMQFLL